ncbi:DUF2768 domain-containing protein [Aeribacillus pallidus]|jgi:glucan phosphoethanolaminetransferase (alkaline phosphatase superfamily)|uniref:DUF2768 domain-containing protein n=1 Tax=Aeribacillus pallidus TaxID=33936 RepID=UPI003D1FF31B
MSPAMMKMWISFAAMGAMFVSILAIYISRYKLKGFFKWIVALLAYIFMISGGLMMLYVVLSGPTV